MKITPYHCYKMNCNCFLKIHMLKFCLPSDSVGDWTFKEVAAKSLQSCPTLCDPIDGSPSGSPVPGILQAEHWSGLPFPFPMHESEK